MCHQSLLFEEHLPRTSAKYVKFRRTVDKIRKEIEVRDARKKSKKSRFDHLKGE